MLRSGSILFHCVGFACFGSRFLTLESTIYNMTRFRHSSFGSDKDGKRIWINLSNISSKKNSGTSQESSVSSALLIKTF